MIEIFPNIEQLNEFAARKFVEIAREAIEKRGIFTVALAGGSTPKSLYQLLASEKFIDKIDWTKAFFFFGDERHVPPDDPQSNFRMANENLFQTLKISKKNIIRWISEEKYAEVVADDYELRLWDFFDKKGMLIEESDAEPSFDLILLGMGADGHTASLFPCSEALHETDKLATENWVEKLQTTRLTLTFPIINNASNVMFLVSGAEKAESLREVLQGEHQPDKFPAQKVKLNDGNLYWLIEREAARLLQ